MACGVTASQNPRRGRAPSAGTATWAWRSAIRTRSARASTGEPTRSAAVCAWIRSPTARTTRRRKSSGAARTRTRTTTTPPARKTPTSTACRAVSRTGTRAARPASIPEPVGAKWMRPRPGALTRAVVALLGFVGGVACALGGALAIAIARAPAPAGPAVVRWCGGAVLAPLVRRRTLHGSSTRAPRHAEEPATTRPDRPFRTPHRRRSRAVTARDHTDDLSSHSGGQGFDPSWLHRGKDEGSNRDGPGSRRFRAGTGSG